MFDLKPQRHDDGGIDYDHYRRHVHQLRTEARRRVLRNCAQLASRLIGATVGAANLILFPAGAAVDCVVCESKPLDPVIASRPTAAQPAHF